MEKNTILAIVLSTIVIIVGFTVQSIFYPAPLPEQMQDTVKIETAEPGINAVDGMADIIDFAELEKERTLSSPVSNETEHVVPEITEKITTNVFEVTFTNRGGDITSIKLLNHKDNGNYIEMADGITGTERAFSLFLGDDTGALVDSTFEVKKISDYSIGFFKTFTKLNSAGEKCSFTLVKRYEFKPDNYMFELTVTVDGDEAFDGFDFNRHGYTLATSPQIGPEFTGKDRYEYRTFYTYINGKDKKVTVSPGKKEQKTDRMTWTAVGGKYFTIAAIPETFFNTVTFSAMNNSNGEQQSRIFLTRPAFTDKRVTDKYRFYVGPKTEEVLKTYNTADSNPYGLMSLYLNEIVDTSSLLGWLETLLKWIMQLFFHIVPNWGVCIILTTILVKALFFPLTKKSSVASKKMQEIQPAMKEIQEKYKDKPEKMNQEMALLYQKAGTNPMSGCLPMLIQFPILIAMYNLFNSHFELRGANFIAGWIPDLSKGDSILSFPFALPLLGWTELRLLPIIYMVSQLVYSKITQAPGTAQTNGSMKFMMFGMPILFFFMFYNAPAGLLLYWSCSNILQMIQQFVINKVLKNTDTSVPTVPAPRKKRR